MIPTPYDVERVIEQYEIDDEREKEALRAFWDRERQKRNAIHVRWNWLLGTLAFLCIAAAGYLFVILWLSL